FSLFTASRPTSTSTLSLHDALPISHGRGACVFDSTGKKYLDFLGGIAVNALGHAHPRIVKVIRREAARAIHLSNLYHNAYQGPLDRKSTRLNSSHVAISYAVFCLKK